VYEELKRTMKNQSEGISFSFGANWKRYLNSLTIEKIQIAKQSLKDFLGNVTGKTCIDIGSGSGIFSYLMYVLGAKEVTSIDVDLFSVQCAQYLKRKVKNPEIWKIYQGSILDDSFISQFDKYDIVYSWGVLHHTGNMWKAIKNAASLVNDNGILFIAIYNKTRRSKFWLKVKKVYNLSPQIGKKLMNFILLSVMYFILPIISLKNPLNLLKNYKKKRGMDPMIDIRDWLGGYPFEVATFKEVVNFLKKIDQNLRLIKYHKVNLNASENNEFVFKNEKF
jgi:2-polyprenyl-6-hydroxyphenyl methylase/3-demethylubiquinone-9 3-methyltransferase